MLYLIGIGLKPEHLTLEGLEALKNCKTIYLESYTSIFAEGSPKELRKILDNKEIIVLDRTQVEEKYTEIFEKAKKENTALLIFGNVFSATTHAQLFADAKQAGIETKFVPGVSIKSYLGRTGLSEYKFGETVSIVLPEKNYAPDSFYFKILKNLEIGLHTLCLLDVKPNYFMSVSEGLQVLKNIEDKQEEKILIKQKIIALSKASAVDEKIIVGSIDELIAKKLETPASFIVCGKLNHKEEELLELLSNDS